MKVYISNASSHNVYAKVDCDIGYQKATNIAVDASAGAFGAVGVSVNKETQWKEATRVGYTTLNRYSSLEFHPDSTKKVCYVTIEIRKEKSKISICEDHPLGANRGLIIDKSLYVHTAKEGSTWIDTDGIRHRPDIENKDELPKNEDCSTIKAGFPVDD